MLFAVCVDTHKHFCNNLFAVIRSFSRRSTPPRFVRTLPRRTTGVHDRQQQLLLFVGRRQGRNRSPADNVTVTRCWLLTAYVTRRTFNALAMVKVLNRNFLCASVLAIALALGYEYWSVSNSVVA